MIQIRNFINGQWQEETGGKTVPLYNPSTGETEQVYAQKTVPIENYSAEWYAQRDAAAILKQVSSVYRGNYTTSYAANNDYSKTTKEVWINAKGYSSNTNYLVWINRAYQHVNVFTGSKGNWKLTKSFIVGTGAASTPTPVGVTTVSYKLKAGWTTGTYTVRPVVGFYPGTGYAFHSRLCYPGTDTEYDFSSGYPVSHGCVRMKHNDINWIYNNVPIGSTVVIYKTAAANTDILRFSGEYRCFLLQNSVYIINILSCTATINSHPDSVIRHFIRIFRKCNWLSL